MTRALKSVSENARIVLALEGGYDPRGVADCVVEVVAAMAERAPAFAADELESGAQTKHISRWGFTYLRRCSRWIAPFADASLVHQHTLAAVKETKERLSAHWKL